MPNRLRGLALELLPESPYETSLPDSGVSHDREQVRLPSFHGAPVCRLQEIELALPSDERASEAGNAPRSRCRERANEPPACNGVRLAFDREGCRLVELERSMRGGRRPLPHEDVARPGRQLEPRGDVHRVAGHER